MKSFVWRGYDFEQVKDTWRSSFGWVYANPVSGFVATRYYCVGASSTHVESVHGYGATREEALDACLANAETIAKSIAPLRRARKKPASFGTDSFARKRKRRP